MHLQTMQNMNLDYRAMSWRCEESRLAVLFGQFFSVNGGRRAEVVPWRAAINDDVQTRADRVTSYFSKIKKKQAAEISPSNGDDEETI